MSDGVNLGLQKAAENALLQVAARWLVVALCMTALPVGGWMGNRLVTAIDQLSGKVDALSIDMATVKTDIAYLKQRITP